MRQLEERHGGAGLSHTAPRIACRSPMPAFVCLNSCVRRLIRFPALWKTCINSVSVRLAASGFHATHIAAAAAIAAVWGRFASTYPDVHLEILVETRPIDLVASSFDAGIGRREWAGADMIAVRVIGPMKVAMVGAPEYFEQRPSPRTLDDLASHSCIQYRFAPNEAVLQWSFERNGRTKRMSLAGRGDRQSIRISLFAQPSTGLELQIPSRPWVEPFLRTGQLVRVLERSSPCLEGLFGDHPGRRAATPAALRVFIDMLRRSQIGVGRRSREYLFQTDCMRCSIPEVFFNSE